jgi:RNA 3'-terminal phosphate cyclase (ATP)
MITIDGSYGEGGGQILRTSLTLAAILQRPVCIERIRARRPEPGLRPQHLTAVRAIAAICGADMEGDHVGSERLVMQPGHAPRPGDYTFDVSQMAKGGSAGAVSLIFQTVLLPLALAEGPSYLTLRGGTHVSWSPPYHYLAHVYLPALARLGVDAEVHIERWGWYPRGDGEMTATIAGNAHLRPHDFTARGERRRVWGISASSNLPPHVRQRQMKQALARLGDQGIAIECDLFDAPSTGPGASLFICPVYTQGAAGFTGYGRLGFPAEKVADVAVDRFLAYERAQGAVDPHLADQLVLPLALAGGALTTVEVTQHQITNIWVVEQFLGPRCRLEGEEGEEGRMLCSN